jgi:uncharacterized membrane protein YfcA
MRVHVAARRPLRERAVIRDGDRVSSSVPLLDSTTLYVLAVVFLATLIRSTFGFGEALVAVPLLALRIPVAVAAPLAVSVSVMVAAVIVSQDWRKIELRSAAGLVTASLFGIPVGLFLLTRVHDVIVRVTLGVVIMSFSGYSLVTRQKLHLKKDHPLLLIAAGVVSGILGGAYGMNGPPLAIYGSLRRWSPQHFRATLQGYFLPASLLGLIGYVAIGLWTPAVTKYLLVSVPAALVAIVIGRSLNRRLRGDRFFRYVYGGLIVIGGVLVAQALSRR